MYLVTVGLNYRSAPLETREKLSLGQADFGDALGSLLQHVEQGVPIFTCNRTEVYAAGSREIPVKAVQEYLASLSGMSQRELAPYLYIHQQEDAVRHLFRVTSGLDSMILGEFEVLGQVRRAMEDARSQKLLPMPMRRLFEDAVRLGRRVRNETAISHEAVSVSSAAVEQARRIFGEVKGRKVLIVSAGEAGELALEAVVKAGAFDVRVTSRYPERAEKLVGMLGGTVLPYSQIEEGIAESDIVITSSYAPHFIIHPYQVQHAMKLRPQRPLLLIDIAVPRDIDPDVGKIPGVHLCDIDGLKEVCEANRTRREQEVEKVSAIIEGEVTKFVQWWRGQAVVPTVVALREKAEAIRQAKLAGALRRLKNLSEEDRAQIEALTVSLVDKILHDPISCLKNDGVSPVRSEVVRELFKLDDRGRLETGRLRGDEVTKQPDDR